MKTTRTLICRTSFRVQNRPMGRASVAVLVPVPDVMQYRDQLEEINLLTGRIHALSDAVECKGFYPAGGGEVADAIQTAMQTEDGRHFAGADFELGVVWRQPNPMLWLPIDMIATTITALVMLRKQIIDDIYQITGMADIMRGDTDPQETLGAQQLKTQYGSTRIRDKQGELARLARDLVEITSRRSSPRSFRMRPWSRCRRRNCREKRDVEQQMQQLSQQMMQLQQHMAQQPPQAPAAAGPAATAKAATSSCSRRCSR